MSLPTIAFSSPSSRPARRAPGTTRSAVVAAVVAWALALPACALSQDSKPSFTPEVGQPGKDVIWVPTPQALVDKMLDMAKATPKDVVFDLGSGDGRTVITAAKRGITAHGIEYNPDMVELAKRNAEAAGVSARATFEKADLFESDFSKAQVITMFLLPSINETLSPKLLGLAPGTRIVSNSFRMGEWAPDESVTIPDCTGWCTAHLWIVPAKVAGTWRVGSQDLALKQTYQMLSGTLGSAAISEGKVDGNTVAFTAEGVRYQGTVSGSAISGKTTGKRSGNWTATKK